VLRRRVGLQLQLADYPPVVCCSILNLLAAPYEALGHRHARRLGSRSAGDGGKQQLVPSSPNKCRQFASFHFNHSATTQAQPLAYLSSTADDIR